MRIGAVEAGFVTDEGREATADGDERRLRSERTARDDAADRDDGCRRDLASVELAAVAVERLHDARQIRERLAEHVEQQPSERAERRADEADVEPRRFGKQVLRGLRPEVEPDLLERVFEANVIGRADEAARQADGERESPHKPAAASRGQKRGVDALHRVALAELWLPAGRPSDGTIPTAVLEKPRKIARLAAPHPARTILSDLAAVKLSAGYTQLLYTAYTQPFAARGAYNVLSPGKG